MNLIRRWFGLDAVVDKRFYLLSGIGLMVLRCLGDCAIVFGSFGEAALSKWHPLIYVAPTFGTRVLILEQMSGEIPTTTAVLLMSAWALPFAWIGISMSIRRARNAGVSGWIGLLFFVPVINVLAIAALCIAPTKTPPEAQAREHPFMGIWKSSMRAVAYSSVFGVVVTAVSVRFLGDYGYALFVAGPVVMGAIAGWQVNRNPYRGYRVGLAAGVGSGILTLGMLLLFAVEGIVCLVMVAPLATGLILIGALIGTAMARPAGGTPGTVGAMALMLPLISMGEHITPPALPVYSVVSQIKIDAPPEQVWPNVIGFSELPPPADWVLQTGIATPMRARIEGDGVGAIRYCEFTTGPFVEPITHWQPPTRLAFDVTAQPAAMEEWSPWEEIYAPHIEDTMVSQRGEFQLQRTPDGGTLLQGTTWYTLDLSPGLYWRLWSDTVVHRIHIRVLKHIKQLSEPA
jgi:uncharacterized membrane protein YhaH (DUF805 family)